MQEVYFPVLFPEYSPPGGLADALAQLLVTAAEVDQAARSIRLTAASGVYIAQLFCLPVLEGVAGGESGKSAN